MNKFIVSTVLMLPLSSFVLADTAVPAARNPAQQTLAENAQAERLNPAEKAAQNIRLATTKLMLTDKSFVKKTTMNSETGIELARLALVSSKERDVQAFAKRVIEDNAAVAKEVAAIAQAKNIDVPDNLDMSHQADIDKLAKLTDAKFDRAFREQMQEDQDRVVNLFTAAADDNSLDPQLQQFAAKMLPTLRDRQHEAHMLRQAESLSSAQR